MAGRFCIYGIILMCQRSAVQQPVHKVQGLDTIIGSVQTRFHGEHDLLIIIPDLMQWGKFPFADVPALHGFRYLDIEFVVGGGGDGVHFLIADLPDAHIIAPAEQFEVDYILNSMPAVPIAED